MKLLKTTQPLHSSQGKYLEGRLRFPEESSPWEGVPAASPSPCPELLVLAVPKQWPPGAAEGGAGQTHQGRGRHGAHGRGQRAEGQAGAGARTLPQQRASHWRLQDRGRNGHGSALWP